MKQTIEQWFMMLNRREKILVTGGLLVAIVIVLWGFVLQPMHNKRLKLLDQINERETELHWMQGSRDIIKQTLTNGGKPSRTPAIPGSPSRAVESALQKFGLKQGLKSMQGNKELLITLKKVDADNFMQFLGMLEARYGLEIQQMELTPLNSQGDIDVSLKIGKPGE